ncbi:unnamed protein product [Arabidopsis thaliana]|nr:unnamed protein product [Arabidopsis thaliana]
MKIGVVLVLLTVFVVVMSSTSVSAQSDEDECLKETGQMQLNCFPYLTDNRIHTPSFACCSEVYTVGKTYVDCFCQFINNGGPSFGIVVSQKLLDLPELCGVYGACGNGASFATFPFLVCRSYNSISLYILFKIIKKPQKGNLNCLKKSHKSKSETWEGDGKLNVSGSNSRAIDICNNGMKKDHPSTVVRSLYVI